MTTETQELINNITSDLVKSHLPLAFLNPIPNDSDEWQVIKASNIFGKDDTTTLSKITELMLESIPREFKKALMYGVKQLGVKSMYELVGPVGGQFEYYIDIDTKNTHLTITNNRDNIDVYFKLVYTVRQHTDQTLDQLRAMANS